MKLTKTQLEDRIKKARGEEPAELVLRGAKYLDVFSGAWLTGDIAIHDGVIVGVGEKYLGVQTINLNGRYLVPGFIDSHVHIESTLMTPSEFERTVLPRGTTSCIVDPHEIVNVMGTAGLEYVLSCAEKSLMDIFVMLSSCVPATHLETSGAKLTAADLLPFKHRAHVLGLAEVMNYPGVIHRDSEVIEKLYQFQDVVKDGHAPMLRGRDLNAYLTTGIHSCHESVSIEEAREKLERGMQVLLREGSVAKNLRELVGVLTPFSSPKISLCTDDRNPADILDEGHLDYLIRLAIKAGASPASVYRAASWSTAQAYGLKQRGAIAPGYVADVVVLKDFKKCTVEKVFKHGRLVNENSLGAVHVEPPMANTMAFRPPAVGALQVCLNGENSKSSMSARAGAELNRERRRGKKSADRSQSVNCRVIGIIKDNITTADLTCALPVQKDVIGRDLKNDVLKIAVCERYGKGLPPAVGFVKGMGLKRGAIGSSVGHDSHNVVAIGTNDSDMVKCFERLKELGGGFIVVENGKILAELALPIAGLMTPVDLKTIYRDLKKLRVGARKIGCPLAEPFLQMAFLCLPVIPSLKITDRGLVDVLKFEFASVVIENQDS